MKLETIKGMYQSTFYDHGTSGQGVGWLDNEVQDRRFRALMDGNQYGVSSILDVGCGWGALVEFLGKTKRMWFNHIPYTGIDIVPEMIDVARAQFGHTASTRTLLNERLFHEVDVHTFAEHYSLQITPMPFDLVVCSGGLTYHDMPEKLKMLDAMWELTNKVLAFNVRSTDVYIGDLNMIIPRYTRNWKVRHDYGLDDMTVVLRK